MQTIRNGVFYNGDAIETMATLAPGSVDMILCDLPYGTTQNKWDAVIPFAPLWAEFWRVTKPNAAIVLTCAQPFTTALIGSQIKNFKYSWVWHKSRPSGQLNAKTQPLRDTEDIPVFYKRQPTYHPQMWTGKPNHVSGKPHTKVGSSNYGKQYEITETTTDQKYPRTVLKFDSMDPTKGIHPTQKPVALFEYLIRTYSTEGDLILDCCMGSGTTAVAAERSGRRWVGIEQDPNYYWLALARLMDGDK